MPSTAIRQIDYHPERRVLEVEFVTGRRYVYFGVATHEAEALRAASSKGRHFNARIRDRYDYEEVVGADR